MKELTIKQKAEAYDKAIEELRDFYRDYDIVSGLIDVKEELANIFPEIKKSKDEIIRQRIIHALHGDVLEMSEIKEATDWLENQSKQKPNPYSGTSFEYNGHTWGMCARDNGVEILFDGELKAFLSLEKSIIYPIHSQSELAPKSALEAIDNIDDKEYCCILKKQDKSGLEAIKEENVDNANKVEPKDYNSIDPHFGKPADKVEPKFKVGDWIVNNKSKDVFFIKSINSGYCSLEDTKGNIYSPCLPFESDFHLWSIKDANDGDVLYSLDSCRPFIYKERKQFEQATAYCGINVYGKFFVRNTKDCIIVLDKYVPATKEQRDLLFAKMKEAGYEWDAEKKELKIALKKMPESTDKVEPFDKYEGLTDFERALADICMGWIGEEHGWKQYIKDNADVLLRIAVKMFNSVQDASFEQEPAETVKWSPQEESCICQLESLVKEQWRQAERVHNSVNIKKMSELMFFLKTLNPNKKPQRIISAEAKEAMYNKSAWSEEDEEMFEYALDMIEWYGGKNEDKSRLVSDWLKSLKDRIQARQEWSGKDERYVKDLADYFTGGHPLKYAEEDIADWFKSLKDRYAWKPSEEMLEALDIAIRVGIQLGSWEEKALRELQKQLKEL